MSDENQSQNQDSTENSLPTSPQEPTPPSREASGGQSERGTENTAHSEPTEALPEIPESLPSDFSVKSTDIYPPPPSRLRPLFLNRKK